MADNLLLDNGALDDYQVKTTEVAPGIHAQHVRIDLDAPYTIEVDDAGTYSYFGWATPGTSTAAASWRIARVENVSGSKRWADGNGAFDNVWDNRASLSFS